MTYDETSGFATEYVNQMHHEIMVPELQSSSINPFPQLKGLGLTGLNMADVTETFAVSAEAFTNQVYV